MPFEPALEVRQGFRKQVAESRARRAGSPVDRRGVQVPAANRVVRIRKAHTQDRPSRIRPIDGARTRIRSRYRGPADGLSHARPETVLLAPPPVLGVLV